MAELVAAARTLYAPADGDASLFSKRLRSVVSGPGGLEVAIRLACFGAVLASVMALEWALPRRALLLRRGQRWPANIAMVGIATVAARLIIPFTVIGVAATAEAQHWGLFGQLALPGWVEVLLAVVLLDLVIYGQHVAFHAQPWLWRIHRMHHSDLDLDVSTALRFHPVEILLSVLLKCAAVMVLGASPLAVLIFEILLNATAMFNHGNIAVPPSIDALLRRVLVTPDMHRVHHSIDPLETNSNYGFNLPWWDRLFGTYRAQPAAGHHGMTIGLCEFREMRDQRLDQLLVQPLRRDAMERGTP